MKHPIPSAALDDRLGFFGTAGSGKTYGSGTAVERVLNAGSRCVIVDPLGVWWGLRLREDGKTESKFDVVIFGGPHGDLPLTENSGALIGEAVATSKESCIIDLSQLGTKAAERRFMLAFLTAFYRHTTGEPVHLIFDEADMWAPQRLMDKDGDAAKLLGMMETIVRRGRVKGFIPWLISQRTAVISKDVLSQIDGLVIFKLTSSQDRSAIGDWIDGQADKVQGKEILAGLPTKQRGEAVVWIPGRGVLDEAPFPAKVTFDSSRTPKRGEKAAKTGALKQLDVGKLKEKLATVETETKANDPKALKARIAELERAVTKAPAKEKIVEKVVSDPRAIEAAFQQGVTAGFAAIEPSIRQSVDALAERVRKSFTEIKLVFPKVPTPKELSRSGLQTAPIVNNPIKRQPVVHAAVAPPSAAGRGDGNYSGPQMRVLRSLAMWRALGHEQPTKEMVGTVAGYSPTSGGYANLLSSLRTVGAVEYPSPGRIVLRAERVDVPSRDEGRDLLLTVLSNPQRKIVDACLKLGGATKEAVGEETGYSATSGGFANLLSSLRTIGIIDYPQPGHVALSDWARELL